MDPKKRFDYCDPMLVEGSEVLNGDGTTYRGLQNRTVNGNLCQAWSQQYPNRHPFTKKSTIEKYGLEGNYCRNPDNTSSIWCYTAVSGKPRFELCKPIVKTGEELNLAKNGADYRGKQNFTILGKECAPWSQVEGGKWTRGYPNGGLDGNYCRNPDNTSSNDSNYAGLWCKIDTKALGLFVSRCRNCRKTWLQKNTSLQRRASCRRAWTVASTFRALVWG